MGPVLIKDRSWHPTQPWALWQGCFSSSSHHCSPQSATPVSRLAPPASVRSFIFGALPEMCGVCSSTGILGASPWWGEELSCGNGVARTCTITCVTIPEAFCDCSFGSRCEPLGCFYPQPIMVRTLLARHCHRVRAALRNTPLHFRSSWWVVALQFSTLRSCWHGTGGHHWALLALPSALGQGEAWALLWYLFH